MTISTSRLEKRPACASAPSRSNGEAPAVQRPAEAAAQRAERPVSAGTGAKATEPLKSKLVRDRFSMPKSEYQAIAQLTLRLGKLGLRARKNALLRAGLKTLAAMSDPVLSAALAALGTAKAAASRPDCPLAAPATPDPGTRPALAGGSRKD